METVFRKTDILLPYYAHESEEWETWSVIACDQHTSEPSYWEETAKAAGSAPSTLSLILPEAYLNTELEGEKKAAIKKAPETLGENFLKKYEGALVYVERTLVSGMIRRGLVGAIPLDSYSYEPGAMCDVRPTEGTVKERIPPRVAVRRESVYEASHVMLFCENSELFDLLTSYKDSMRVLYDFDLMQGGGHITGRLVEGELLERAEGLIGKYEDERRAASSMLYGVGDGNHSLASAKAYLEELREAGADIGGASEALVELTPITDPSIVFEPIYKTVRGVDPVDLLTFIKNRTYTGEGATRAVRVHFGDNSDTFHVSLGEGEIVCGVLQSAIDDYLSIRGGTCDYIHGKENLLALAERGAVGFIFDGVEKEDLFPYVSKYGVLPRKAFSMGEACEKRYYTELRLLKY